MKSLLHSDNRAGTVNYESTVAVKSTNVPGVTFTVSRMSFGRRMELFRLIREIAANLAYLDASSDFREQVEATLLEQEIENLYLRWGLVKIDGLSIDGEPATTELLLERGPDELAREIAASIKTQCGLTEVERKN